LTAKTSPFTDEQMELLYSRLVILIGSMLVVGFGRTIAALKSFLA
jgi:hypothetical protein